jgi:hypothetical protein
MGDYYKWNGNEVMQQIMGGTLKNLGVAADELVKEEKQLLSTPGRKVTTTITKTGKTRNKYGKKNEFTSAPGDPPFKQTGRLQRSVRKKVLRKLNTVRVTFKGNLMEYGTVNVAARPSLRPLFERLKPRLAEIATQPIIVK